ncbi:NADH-quinone oxidoreductase subunit NuoF [Vibrio marisflavi]|uniref:NADH-quinone oxidoreductase subunit F n=1 Tax=Vibrio marisflavi CECT 7928 TaxID=634439 RepID=A0ABM9A1X0_9VIBR|nr:NADH-quinone oxidoreductase subunit NuoF [Vibrio marisflavi]CAH0537077.1 NADH-quinone oxidoreductase subunit F [Vibrio marisflavi CECT 7928]
MDLVLSRNFHNEKPLDLAGYQAAGGYESLETIIGKDREPLLEEIKASGLRGCGGGGFPTGVKWGFLAKDASHPVYLVVNLDESEPGSFKDRQVLYRDPHTILEGVIASSYLLGADKAFVFIRGEYREGAKLLEKAVEDAKAAGLVGKNIKGSGWDLDVDVHLSAGRYICGEETALLNALEGYRGNPRAKPPFPIVKGLWGQPTIINNVETVCHIPWIAHKGAEWFKSQGKGNAAGSHIYQVSGPVKKPGFFELPMGTTARELIFEHAGGLLDGRELVGFLPGGASTQFMLPEHLDVPLDWDGPASVGSRLGTGGIIVMDDSICPIDFMINLTEFFARESCGYCTPCRDGLPYVVHVLEKFEKGVATAADLDLLHELCDTIYPNTFCALAPGALMPIMAGLKHFRHVFEAHIEAKACTHEMAASVEAEEA